MLKIKLRGFLKKFSIQKLIHPYSTSIYNLSELILNLIIFSLIIISFPFLNSEKIIKNVNILYPIYIVTFISLYILILSLLNTAVLRYIRDHIFESLNPFKSVLWNLGSIITGIMFYLLSQTELDSRNIDYQYDFTFQYFLFTLLFGFYFFGLILYLSKGIYIEYSQGPFKTFQHRISDEFERLNKSNTRFGFYIGYIFKKVYLKLIYVCHLFVVIIAYMVLFALFATFIILFLLSIYSFNLDLITPLILLGFLILIISSFLFFLFLLIKFQLFFVKHLCLFLINIALGIEGRYKLVSISLNEKKITINEFSKDKILKYWQPITEFSFFLIAIFYFLNQLLNLEIFLAGFISIFLGYSLIFTMWIFDDLNIDNSIEIPTFFNFVKAIRFSKKSIQLATIFSIGIWLYEMNSINQYPNIFTELPIISFFYKLFGGGIFLLFNLGLLNVFGWFCIRPLRPIYLSYLKLIKNRINSKNNYFIHI